MNLAEAEQIYDACEKAGNVEDCTDCPLPTKTRTVLSSFYGWTTCAVIRELKAKLAAA